MIPFFKHLKTNLLGLDASKTSPFSSCLVLLDSLLSLPANKGLNSRWVEGQDLGWAAKETSLKPVPLDSRGYLPIGFVHVLYEDDMTEKI